MKRILISVLLLCAILALACGCVEEDEKAYTIIKGANEEAGDTSALEENAEAGENEASEESACGETKKIKLYTGGEGSTKYHHSPTCPGKNSHEIDWTEVEARKLEPCKKCVG